MNSLHTLSAYKNNNTERTVHTLSMARDRALREQLSVGRLLVAPNVCCSFLDALHARRLFI